MRDFDGLAPGSRVMGGEEFALILAISPLALSIPAIMGGTFGSLAVIPLLVVAQALAVLADQHVLARQLGNDAALPSPASFLWPGAYLAHRARALRRSDDLVWAWICAMLHSIAVLALSAALIEPSPIGAAVAVGCPKPILIAGKDCHRDAAPRRAERAGSRRMTSAVGP